MYSNGQLAAGRIRYRHLQDDSYTYIAPADATYQGTGLPTQLFSLSQQLVLKRFTLDAQADALAGHQLLNTTLVTLDLPSGTTNGTTALLDRWTPTRYNPTIPAANLYPLPAVTDFFNRRYSDAALQSAAHLRLTQLTITYALRPATVSRHPTSVWVGAQNLFVLTRYRGFDPNVSSGGSTQVMAGYDTNAYPVARTWLLGVKAEF